jgi:predicted deacetylase
MDKLPAPAQYLLRIDDLCPTVHVERWQRISAIIGKHGIRPMLAVVPDNRDPDLMLSASAPHFWADLRRLEKAGATIALHGFQHLCVRRARALIPLHRTGEFAGVAFEIQRQWIRQGLDILRAHGLQPRLWVAPRHSFDRTTLRVLRAEGVGFLSDGLALRPCLREGVVWIPQQLGSPAEKQNGLWTICLHPNSLDDAQFRTLQEFVGKHAAQFTTFERVVREWPPIPLRSREAATEKIAVLRLLARSTLRLLQNRRVAKPRIIVPSAPA